MSELVAIKLSGLADTSEVVRFAEEAMNQDFDPVEGTLPLIQIRNLRDSATLNPFAETGRFMADTILSVHVQKHFKYNAGAVEKELTASKLELVGDLEIPELSIVSADTKIGIKHNKGRQPYYSVIARCLFKR